MSDQTQLIGAHPPTPNIFNKWLKCDDVKPSKTKRHRSLTELIKSKNSELVKWLAERLIFHHYDESRIQKLKKKYKELGFPEYAKLHRKLPLAENTQKGNATEIILIEYVEACQQKALIKAFKLRYNPNVDQSMKGDDMLMVDIFKDAKNKDRARVFLGEAKFRKTPTKTIVDEISAALGKDKLPLSYSFMIDELSRDKSTEKEADLLEKFIINEIKAKGDLTYVGFLISNADAFKTVETHLKNGNPSLVFVSAGINNPEALIDAAFKKAEKIIAKPTTL